MYVISPSIPLSQTILSWFNTGLATSTGVRAMDWIPGFLMVVGVILLGLIFSISIRSKIAARKAAQPSPRQRIDQIKAARQSRDDFHVMSAEIHDTVHELSAKLINRAEQLEQLIDQADRCRAELQTLIEQVSHTTKSSQDPETEYPSSPPPTPPHTSPVSPDPPSSEIVGNLDPLTQSVYELADSGKTTLEIAQQLDEQIGKVQLILSLRAEIS